MIFRETRLKGVFEIDLELHSDERGFFARSYCWREFEAHGLNPRVVQCNVSYNRKRGTAARHALPGTPRTQEAKLIRCVRGALYDVIVDLRPDSPTFRQWTGGGIESRAGAPVADAVCAGRIRPRLSDARGRHRSLLSDVRVLRAGGRAGIPLERPGVCDRVAGAGARDFGPGSHLSGFCRDRRPRVAS